jgi:hypothetical protein
MNWNFFWAMTAANQWHTNSLLEENNDLLEKIRRQGLTPAERAAEDKAEADADTLRGVIGIAVIIILILAFLIFGACYNARVQQSEHGINDVPEKVEEAE